jgi:large conductance mechanosensitive channel
MKKVMGEFKEFIAKGNVIDLAVGVIIGGAFAKITASLVNDIFMPVLGLILGNINLAGLKIVFREGTDKVKELAMNIGLFIQTVIDFLLIGLVLFLLVKLLNAFRRKKEKKEEAEEKKEPVISEEVKLLTEIRDLLKK